MILTCPSCATRYNVDGDKFPAEGRTVRCANCAHQWHAQHESVSLPDTAPAPQAPEDVIEEAEEFTASPFDAFIDSATETPAVDGLVDPDRHAVDVSPMESDPEFFDATDSVESGARISDDAEWAADEPEPENIESAARRAWHVFRASGRSRRQPAAFAWLQPVAIGALMSLLVAFGVYREDVVRIAPSTASLFELAGLEINLRGLVFEDLRQERTIDNGVPILKVEGSVRNISDAPVLLPQLGFSLEGAQGNVVYRWTIGPPEPALEPGQSTMFRTRLAAPPDQARNVVLTFVEDELQLGSR